LDSEFAASLATSLALSPIEHNRLVALLGPHQPAMAGGASNSSGAQPPTDDRLICVMCLANEREIIFRPCRHYVSCKVCCTLVKDCPICRKGISKCEEVYT
jgi:hypothetical protein